MSASYLATTWFELYAEAVMEPDPEQFVIRVGRANQAILTRILKLRFAGPPDKAEQDRLISALYFLELLRQNVGVQNDN